MKYEPIACAGVALVCLSACIMPPSMYERAAWGPPREDWQDQGRYRPAVGPASEPARAHPQYQTSADPHAESFPPSAPSAPVQQAPLYAWDGGVVDGAPQGRVAEQEGTPRGLETPPEGRMHIIELYQQALDERDALASEVEILRRSLEETSAALEQKTKEALDLRAQVASLESVRTGLMSDNQDIAARLVQAQIRRLEAEKLLLETRIDVERTRAEEAALAAAQSRAGMAKPRSPAREPAKPEGEEQE